MREISGNAPGKLNLSLDVTGRRPDGYHLVRMVMQTVELCDTVTVKRTSGPGIGTHSDSEDIPSGPANLVWRAADVMRRQYGITDGLSIEIEKRIPVAAGMAGGSADAAAVLRLLRQMYGLEIPDEELRRLALPLGADVPYCVSGGTRLCEGIGEVLTPLPPVPPCVLLIVKPGVNVSTGWVYQAYDSIPADRIRHPDVDAMVRAIRKSSLPDICRCLGNVLEQKTGDEYPVIGELERFFMDTGALGSMMTGSGPTVFAVYEDMTKAGSAFSRLREEPAFRPFGKFQTRFV